MSDIYYQLPPELWVKIINYSNEISLLVTDKTFFELIVLVDIDVDIVEYIIDNNNIYLARYVLWLKHRNHKIFDKLIVTNDLLNKQLITCCQTGNLKMVNFVVDLGANIKTDNYSIPVASLHGYLEIVKYLVNKSDNIRSHGDLAVRLACLKGHLEIVKYLISRGADIKSCNNCAIRLASEKGHFEIVKYLVSQGANIRADNNYAIRLASEKGHHKIVEYLISQDADI
ncbi:putative ankyrin repeat protein [Acanthamoeba polyphaga mimivirus]|uniref:Ankyrin repeat protein n=1 Tax=Acanthamoeba polyphaga mimivirus Kroon TaxID=3069720 RepID=A0A0G2Y9Q3_9VIRU|nr:putative ankyrin repeat protein [Acanthamoeba polyphaga mimivirus]AKI80572.1 putative ankyrin repeat protein [Acanthamoeba polyphaga mimivirus Kroon]